MNDFVRGCVFERGFDKDKMNSVERRNKNTKFLFNESKMWNRKGVILLVIY